MLLTLLAGAAVCSTVAGSIEETPGALLSLSDPGGVRVETWIGTENREVRCTCRAMDTEFRRIGAVAGITPLPFLNVRAGAGWVEAKQEGTTGSGGFEWLAGATLSAVELVVRRSPVVGKQQWFSIEADVAYSQGTSNLNNDFEWTRVSLGPRLRFTHNADGSDPWRRFGRPQAYTVYAGVLWDDFEADLGSLQLEGNRDFAFQGGLATLWRPGWVLRLEGTFFTGGDRRLDLGAGYAF